MVQTYTSNEITVNDGGTTVKNPKSLVGENNDIAILSAEVRWKGINEIQATGNENTETTTVTDDTTLSSSTSDTNISSTTSSSTLRNNIPTIPWWATKVQFDRHTATYQITNNSQSTVTISFDYYIEKPDGSNAASSSFSFTLNPGESNNTQLSTDEDLDTKDDALGPGAEAVMEVTDNGGTTDYELEIQSFSFYNDEDQFSVSQNAPPSPDPYVDRYGYSGSVSNVADTQEHAYEANAPNYDFNKQIQTGSVSFSSQDTQSAGSSSITMYRSGGSLTITSEATTYGADEFSTENPSVSGDVSGAISGTLSDGVWSSWTSLSGIQPNSDNTFLHSIAGSNTAILQFRFDWEVAIPEVQAIYKLQSGGATYDLPIVDTNDPYLNYSMLRISLNGTTYAADLVDTSNQNSSPIRIQTTNDGIVSWRTDQR